MTSPNRTDSRTTVATRRQFLKAGAAAAAGATSLAARAWPAPAVLEKRPPNLLLIISDQLGLDAIAAHGCTDARTHNIDRLISRGTTFIESHSSSPVCSPARSSMMTGCMPVETGVISNDRPIHPSRPNLGQWFSEADYETVYCGKWHLPGGYPTEIPGFHVLPVGGGQGDIVDGYCSRACEAYLHQRSKDQPFLLVSSLLQPHDICYWAIQGKLLVPPELPFPGVSNRLPSLPPNLHVRPKAPEKLDRIKYESFSDDQWRYYLYIYYRQVEMVDADVGRMLDALEDTGQADNTVVLFTSDHGDGRGRHQHVSKWYPYDEAAKVPLVVSCPGRLAEGCEDRTHLVSGIDIMDTFCDLAGTAPPKTSGRSLLPLLEQCSVAWREFVASEHFIDGRMLRTERFKYVRFPGDPVEQLFDMQADPWETNNLYQDPQYATVVEDHRRMLARWEKSLDPVEPTGEANRRKPQAKG
ncbi:MAG: sulfatase-like hydrolase/transferase [Rhodopirellula sp.]|nr:sulfatase-like hydrolase/transferase [Rhodopirellula sp.]